MKLDPMKHQERYAEKRKAWKEPYFGVFADQGTGKTYMLLDEAEDQWERGNIEGLVIVAPKSVYSNWTRREIPKLLDAPHMLARYKTGTKGWISDLKAMKMDRDEKLKVFAINYDAVNTTKGLNAVRQFLRTWPSMMILDESVEIKNPKSKRTTRVISVGRLAVRRAIATGTPLVQSPPDLYAQLEFLAEGASGESSYRSFVARYCRLLPSDHPLVKDIASKSRGEPQIQMKDIHGRPIYKNLDRLSKLIEPFTFRVTKEEVLDLPPKVFTTRNYSLSPDQKKFYNTLRNEHGILNGSELFTVNGATFLMAAARINSGIFPFEGEWDVTPTKNPKMEAFMEYVSRLDGQFIVWARFRAEVFALEERLNEAGVSCRTFFGDTSPTQRDAMIDEFQEGGFRAFIANPKAGGEGLTLTNATAALYYTNDFNYRTRTQSEDRNHRIGTVRSVTYCDFVAEGTIDEEVISNLQTKEVVAGKVLGD